MVEIETDTKVLMFAVMLISVVVLALIGSVTYYHRSADLDKFKLEQYQYELLRDGKPTKIEVVVHKLDYDLVKFVPGHDEQFKELIQAIEENK